MKLPMIMLTAAVALSACEPVGERTVSYGNDALPSREMIAAAELDRRLGYANSTIEWDANNCAVYQGTDKGQVKRVPLNDPDGRQICSS